MEISETDKGGQMKKYDIVVLGDINIDHVISRNLSFPWNELISNGLIYWEDMNELPGGSGLNFCSSATAAGYKCLMLGKVGSDLAGSTITEWLEGKNIDKPVNWISTDPTGKAIIMRDSNDIRLIVNNKKNANHTLSIDDVAACMPMAQSSRVIYISGYCISSPHQARYDATVQLMSQIKEQGDRSFIVFDVVPHRIYETLRFDQFWKITSNVDILVSEVATMRRFLKLGLKSEEVTLEMAKETVQLLSDYYPQLILRYGASGCDEEILFNKKSNQLVHRFTGHDLVPDKRGYGDLLTIDALATFFKVLPIVEDKIICSLAKYTPARI